MLVVPWLPPEEQPALYPEGVVFATREEQGAYIKEGALGGGCVWGGVA